MVQRQQADPKKRLRDYSGRAVVDNVERTAKLGDIMSFGGLGTDVSASKVMNTEAWPHCIDFDGKSSSSAQRRISPEQMDRVFSKVERSRGTLLMYLKRSR